MSGDPFIIVEGGVVQNDPALPVLDFDVLAESPTRSDIGVAEEVEGLQDRMRPFADRIPDYWKAVTKWLAEFEAS